MEELQDAIEDVQYLQAVNSKANGPRPTESWPFPNPAQLEDFRAAQAKLDKTCFSLENVTSQILGFHMFGLFCREQGETTRHNFMVDVIRYRSLKKPQERQEGAQGIITKYLTVPPVESQGKGNGADEPEDGVSLRRQNSSDNCLNELEAVKGLITQGPEDGSSPIARGGPVDALLALLKEEKQGEAGPGQDTLPTGAADASTNGSANGKVDAAGQGGAEVPDKAVDRFGPETFDVLEAWVFEELKRKLYEPFLESSTFEEYLRFLYVQDRPLTENDFVLFRVLGRGGFGAVNGCKRGASGKLFAMKVMNKRRVKITRSEDLCWNERRILEAISGPFVVSLKYAFASKNDLFLILDLMTGGDLGFHLQQLQVLPTDMAQYYAARAVLAIEHLHKQGIVYRDLKPENVMLDDMGRSRISDMGLACKITDNLTGACGTRGYWAPEMRLRDSAGKRVPYNESVDWFSMGCMIYEFLCGVSPFRTEQAMNWCADTIKEKDKRIDKALLEMEPAFPPKYFDDTAADLCRNLLAKDPQKRLGRGGAQEIKAHPWFASLDWDKLAADQLESPFVPKKDINAAPQRAIGSFADAGAKVVLSKLDHEIYEGWAYRSVDAFQQEVVDFLQFQATHTLQFDSNEGSCCSVS